jgi:MATE family multidrug resistance protein
MADMATNEGAAADGGALPKPIADRISPVDPAVIAPATTWGGEMLALLRLGWPLIVAQLAHNALLTTDVIMMGWLGGKYLAAGTLAMAFLICLQLLGVGLVGAVAPMVAQALGARDFRSVRRTVRQGFWVAITMFAVLLPVVWNVKPIFALLGQDRELTLMAEQFLHYAVWLLLPAFGIIALRSFLSAHGATRIILIITVAGVVVNGFANYALMFGNWGFPRLELRGSGISTTMVNVVMFGLMLTYVLTHKRFKRYHIIARFWKPDWPRFIEIFRIGGPIGLLLLAEVGLFSAAAFLMGRLGPDEVAGHAIALQFAALAFMVPLGLSQATTVRVGIAYGQTWPEGIRKAGWASLAATLGFMALTCLVFVLFPHQLVGLFLDSTNPANANTLALAASYLGVAALFQLVDGTQVAMASALRGLSDTKMPLVIALVGYWGVGMPVAWILGFNFGLRGIGVWLGLAAGLAFVAAVLTIRFAMRGRLGLLRSVTP